MMIILWIFFCSSAYQAAMQLGQDPSNDCPDSQRTIRTVAQKYGSGGATLGPQYTGRKISIQNGKTVSLFIYNLFIV